MTKYSMEQELGCGVMGGIFQRWNNWSRKSSSVPLPALPAKGKNDSLKKPVTDHHKSKKSSTNIDSANLAKTLPKPNRKSDVLPPRNQRKVDVSRRPSDAARSSTSSSSGSSQKRAPSQDLTSDLPPPSNNSTPKPPFRKNSLGKLGTVSVMGNILRQPSDEFKHFHVSPEALKNKGNVAYKQGRFEEALSLYERAISLDSKQATYRCNKSAALLGLGRLLEAVIECKEAIQLDPAYPRPHHRLATIFYRLGEAEQALYHYKQAGNHGDSSEINAEAQDLNQRLKRCSDARKSNEWSALLKETQCVIASGVDSAPKVYALQTEALLKLHRHQEAYTAYRKGPNFAIESCINFFGLHVSGYLLMIRALVYTASGRLEDALSAAEHAARLDPGNKEISLVVKRIRAVSSARSNGNLLFKESKFLEACSVYGEGLEHDPYNSVLLCNRAACRTKLGQFEKAIEDCTTALNVQPSYSKARLRRADCNAKIERWETAIQDYEMLIRETPQDEEVARALFEAQVQLRKQRGEDVKLEVEDHPFLAKSEAVKSIPAFKIYRNGSRVKEVSSNNPELLQRSIKLYSS